jgi:hypothetical protein
MIIDDKVSSYSLINNLIDAEKRFVFNKYKYIKHKKKINKIINDSYEEESNSSGYKEEYQDDNIESKLK